MTGIRECLIIDDDQDDQEIFVMCVANVSDCINCTTANNGVNAIAMLNSHTDYTPDYIFVDVNMPKMNGIDCLRNLKKIARLQGTTIFMYSTTAEGNAFAESKKLGATDFIIKPTRTGELKEKLAAIFEIPSTVGA